MGADDARDAEQERRFRALYETHIQAISNYAARRVGPGHDPGDVVADVFTTAWRRIGEVPLPPEEILWLYGVARRTVSDHHRSALRRGRLVDRLKVSRGLEIQPSPSDNPAHDRLVESMEKLRPADREALRLVLWEGLSHAQAALVLECSVNAVGIRVHRAKARLQAELSADVEPETADAIAIHRADPTRS